MKRTKSLDRTIAATVFTAEETADYLRISRTTVYRLFNEGALRKVRLGGRTLVRRSDIDALLEKCAGA